MRRQSVGNGTGWYCWHWRGMESGRKERRLEFWWVEWWQEFCWMAWRLRTNTCHIGELIFNWKLRMGKDEFGHKSGGQHTSITLQSRRMRRCKFPWLDSRWWSLAISRIRRKWFSQISGGKTHGCIRIVEQQRIRLCISTSITSCGDRMQRTTRLLCETQWWLHDSYPQQDLVRKWEFILRNCWTSMERTSLVQFVFRMIHPISTWTGKWSLKKPTMWERPISILRKRVNSRERDAVQIGNDIEPVRESRADVEIGNEEEAEESLEAEIPTVETNPKNLMRKAQQEREDCGHAVYRNWYAVCVRGRCVEKHLQVELLKEEEKERTKPSLAAFDHVSVAQSKRRTESNESCVGWTERFHTTLHFISSRFRQGSGFSQDRCELREWTECGSISRIDESLHGERNEETIQKSQDFGGMQHQCEDHRWNFVAQLDFAFWSETFEQAENWSKMETTKGTIWNENFVSKDWRRRYQLNSETKNSRNLCRSSGSNKSNSIYWQEWTREPMNFENWFGGLVPMATGSRVMITETKLASRWQMMKPELK